MHRQPQLASGKRVLGLTRSTRTASEERHNYSALWQQIRSGRRCCRRVIGRLQREAAPDLGAPAQTVNEDKGGVPHHELLSATRESGVLFTAQKADPNPFSSSVCFFEF